MSIPFNDGISWQTYQTWKDAHKSRSYSPESSPPMIRAVSGAAKEVFKEVPVRAIQFIRDAARLVLKVPVRSLATPVFLKKNWKQRERAKINAQLTGYAFLQLLSVPVKFSVALTAIALSAVSAKQATRLLDKSEEWTATLDGKAARLEALKEEGRVHAATREEFQAYKTWLYGIDPKLCRRT